MSPGTLEYMLPVSDCTPLRSLDWASGDFHMATYRIVLPDARSPKAGRGYHGMREDVVLEREDRQAIDDILRALEELVRPPL